MFNDPEVQVCTVSLMIVVSCDLMIVSCDLSWLYHVIWLICGQDPISQPLDAQFLDVYKGTHGVIFMFDMTKQWCVRMSVCLSVCSILYNDISHCIKMYYYYGRTYQYVTRELPLVPYHIPVIILVSYPYSIPHTSQSIVVSLE